MRTDIYRLVQYFFVGGCAALVDLSIFAFFTLFLGFNYLLIAGIGFMVATAVNYWLSIRFVFSSGVRFNRQTEITSVFLVSGVGLVLHELILYSLVESEAAHLLVAKIIALGLVFFWNFSARNFFIFAGPKNA